MLLFDCFYDFVGPFVGKVAVYNEDGVNDTWYPKEQCQNDVEQKLNRLAAEQHGCGRQDNCE